MIRFKTCRHSSAPSRWRCSADSRARAGRFGTAEAAAPELELLRPVRHLRSGAVAARLQGLQGSLQQLPRAQHPLPHARAIPTARASATEQVKALAASYQVTNDTPNDKGEIFKRPGTPADSSRRPTPIPTIKPPRRLSARRRRTWRLLAKARKYERGFPWFIFDALPGVQYQEIGADYIYAILTGYTNQHDPQLEPLLSRATRSPCRSRSPTARLSIPTARRPS